MYIFSNAWRCIGRSKGRNILIGIIVFVIAVSACLGLAIRQAAETAKADTMANLSVTATISFDRNSMMQNMASSSGMPDRGETPRNRFDRSEFAAMMGESSSLTLEEYKIYASASTVKDFYYTLTASFNGSDGFEPVSTETEESTDTEKQGNGRFQMPGSIGRNPQMMGMQNDFSVTGYSGEIAMTSFVNGTSSVTDGVVFAENTAAYDCLISEELATFNGLAVGDTIVITNPSNEEETYTLTVVGLYKDSTANQESFSIMGSTSADPANQIYMSYTALQAIIDESKSVSETVTDENSGRTYETAMVGSLNATYVFADVDAYYTFEEEVRTLGLDESYTVSSSDISSFEASLVPLETLSTMAGYFLLVVLAIGAIILIVLNIFNVRERKYEIGVLTAMGMKKQKVAAQFLIEIFVVTVAAVIIGLGVSAPCAVPVTNALLENQINSQETSQTQVEENFGRGGMMSGGEMPGMPSDIGGGKMNNGGRGFRDIFNMENAVDYVNEIHSAMNLTVVLQMFGVAVLLTLVGGAVSMLFVMRYKPLKILANRD